MTFSEQNPDQFNTLRLPHRVTFLSRTGHTPLRFLFAAVIHLSLGFLSLAQDGTISRSGKFMTSPVASTNMASSATALESLKKRLDIEQTGPDTMRIGRVVLNKRERMVQIPCRVNMRRYVVEYVLVTETGKRHESILVTEAKPEQLHVACLLLGVNATNLPGDYNQPCPVPPSNAVEIRATWNKDGAPVSCPLDKLVVIRTESTANTSPRQSNPQTTDKPMSPGNWFYNGSFFGPNAFQAEIEGSIISLIRDPASLVNNPRTDLDNDKIHYPNERLLPPDGTAVELVLKFK